MSESPNNKMKLDETLADDLVEYITSTYFPIKDALRNRLISKKFRNAVIRSRDLDFSGIYSMRRRQSTIVRIIEDIFNRHKGLEINRFVLILNHIGVEDKIVSWIKACVEKNIQELVLDFSKSKKVFKIPLDFSSIETLTVLKLGWCNFEIPNNSPKGLKLLRTLALTKSQITNDMINAIFRNCIHLETLELIKCPMNGKLSIKTQNQNKFKSLVVFPTPQVLFIVVDAPTLEYFKYDGFVKIVEFSRKVHALKEAYLHYNQNYDWHYYDSSHMVLANIEAYLGVHVLATTNIFLEALTYKYCTNLGAMKKPTFWFNNLKEFQIHFEAPTVCTLYDIAEFITQCPKLEKVLIDIKNFTFEPDMFWKVHYKAKIENWNNKLDSIKKVTIDGYKGHNHERLIVEFFVRKAKSLEKLELILQRNALNLAHGPDYAKIDSIKGIFPGVEVKEV